MENFDPKSPVFDRPEPLYQAINDTWSKPDGHVQKNDEKMPPISTPHFRGFYNKEEIENVAAGLAKQIIKDHFADPTQEKVAEFMDNFPEGRIAAVNLLNDKLAKDGLFLNYEDDPKLASKKYTGQMLKEGKFQYNIEGAVSLIDLKNGKEFPNPLILLGDKKPTYTI